jgi:hypothetical protein
MKTDAAVFLTLVEDMAAAFPPSTAPTHDTLSKFQQKSGTNVMFLVSGGSERLRQYVNVLPKMTEGQRYSALSAITNFEQVFSFGNLGGQWNNFLARAQQQVQALHFIDYIISSQEHWQTRSIDPDNALNLFDELEQVISNSNMPSHLQALIRNDIDRLRYILKNYDKFGEQDYWEKFQSVTGLFGSLFQSLDDTSREKAAPVLKTMIHRVVASLSVSADIAQLATTAFALLPRV